MAKPGKREPARKRQATERVGIKAPGASAKSRVGSKKVGSAKKARLRPDSKRPPRPKDVASGQSGMLSPEPPWFVSPVLVSELSDIRLKEVMRELIRAEAHIAGVDSSAVIVNTDSDAADEGSDGETPKPKNASVWFGDTQTCWRGFVNVWPLPSAQEHKPLA